VRANDLLSLFSLKILPRLRLEIDAMKPMNWFRRLCRFSLGLMLNAPGEAVAQGLRPVNPRLRRRLTRRRPLDR